MKMSDTTEPRESGATEVVEYLRKPYSRILIPQDDGSFSAEILEFPGCFAHGDSADSAYASLEDAATSWLLACLEGNIPIPPPLTNYEVSGKFALRLPRSLYVKATLAAAKEGTSLNQWVTSAVSERLGQAAVGDRIEALLAKVNELALTRTSRPVVELVEPNERRLGSCLRLVILSLPKTVILPKRVIFRSSANHRGNMPEVKVFKFKNLAEILVREAGLQEGNWGLHVKFALTAANLTNSEDGETVPAALVPIVEIGIQSFETPNGLTVDAAEVQKKARP
jgi:predicted RNase H-like HicB family nuclease